MPSRPTRFGFPATIPAAARRVRGFNTVGGADQAPLKKRPPKTRNCNVKRRSKLRLRGPSSV